MLDQARYFMHRPGDEFTAAVWLDGWEHQSLWGWELGYYFLQLWRNDARTDKPFLWLTPADRPLLTSSGSVALAIARTTGADPLDISRALQILPPPALRSPIPTIEGELASLGKSPNDDYCAGQIAAYEWALGRRDIRPGSGSPWRGGAPSLDEVTAEWNMNTGYLNDPLLQNRPHASGVDEALGTIVFDATDG
ncbi:hypothetical protein ACIP5Y_42360 [Nocardia sp. NPDC088792]|uniref:hypothetical protein n=1 Tax=Nocardia sp. NPDC088792 TaxID=3364332 RepID=UPI003804C591